MDPEEIRIKALYRNMILRGKVKLPPESARKLVGPDCAYHLYSVVEFEKEKPEEEKREEEKPEGEMQEKE